MTSALGAIAQIGGSIAGGFIGSDASNTASNQLSSGYTNAMNTANGQINGMFDTTKANYQPYVTAGQGAENTLAAGTQPGGQFDNQFTMSDFLQNQDPAYGFDMQQGSLALQRSAAANGTLMSGGTLKALTQYGQGMASNEFSNAYNRFMTTRQNNFSNVQGVANTGLGAISSLGSLSGQAAGQLSNNTMAGITGAAGAQAAGTMGQANAWQGAIGGATGSSGGSFSNLQQMMQGTTGSSYSGNNSWAPWGQPGYVNP